MNTSRLTRLEAAGDRIWSYIILGDATEAVKLEFRIIEHESQHMDKKEKHKNTDELSPNKRKDGNNSKPGKIKRPKVSK